VDEEDLLPGLPAVERPEDPALRARLPDAAEDRDVDDVRVRRIDEDAADLPRVRQAHEPPRGARVRGEVDAVAVDDVVARVRLARADPELVGVGRGHRDRADRGRLLLEDRLPRQAAVDRLEDAARAGPDVDRVRVAGDAGDRGDAPAARGRADVAELQILEGPGAFGCEGETGGEEETEEGGGVEAASWRHRRGSFACR